MINELFIGRRRELEQFLDGLGKSVSHRNAPLLFRISGPELIGKTAFISHLMKANDQGGSEVLYIGSKEFDRSDNAENWLGHLQRAATSTNPIIAKAIAEFRRNADNPAPKQVQNSPEPVAAEDNAKEEDQPETSQEQSLEGSEEEAAELTDVEQVDTELSELVQPARQWLQGVIAEIAKQEGLCRTRIVFVFDNWEEYGEEKRNWISESFWKTSQANTSEIEVRFIECGQELESIEHTQIYWPGVGQALKDFTLQPFSEEEAKEFLSLQKIAAKDAEKILNESGGIPGKMTQTVNKITAPAKNEEGQKTALSILQGKERQQRTWILRAAHLQLFDPEALEIFGGFEKPETVFNWLKGRIELKLRPQGNSYRIEGDIGNAILQWHEEENPEEFGKYQKVVQAFWKVHDLIPEAKDRKILRLLASFNYFDDAALEEVLPADYETLKTYVQTRQGFFIATDDNYRVAENYYEPLQQLNKISPLSNADELKKSIASCWQRKRDKIVDKAAKTEDNLKKLEKELEVVTQNLTKIRKEERRAMVGVVQAPRGGGRSTGSQKVRTSVPRGRGAILAGVAVEVIGIFLLYMGILFADSISIAYCSLGFLLVLGGLFWPYKKTVVQAVPAGGAPAPQPQVVMRKTAPNPNDQNARLLTMKIENLENKRKTLVEKVARSRRELNRFDTLLHESYC